MLTLVSTRLADNGTYPERRDALSHDWGHFFDRFDLLPILIPNSLADPRPYLKLGAKGLLLTGGDSLGTREAPSERDRTEAMLINAALDAGVPIFGVCRGLQMLNRYFGGDVIKLDDRRHIGTHPITLQDQSVIEVNSFHNEAVTKDTLARDLIPFAATKDGIIEAFTHATLPVMAIQWHPERSSPSAAYDQFLIEQWKALCA